MFAGVTLPGWVRLLFPLLKPKFVAEKIVEGVQKDKEVVVIPPVFWYVHSYLPSSFFFFFFFEFKPL